MTNTKHVSFSDTETLTTDNLLTPQKSSASCSTSDSPSKSGLKRLSPEEHKTRLAKDDDSILRAKKTRTQAYYKAWKGDDGYDGVLMLSPEITRRLFDTYPLLRESFEHFLSVYVEYKFSSALKESRPYTVPSDYYQLFRNIADVTHELFADAINVSGVLRYFCSINRDDLCFGSVGPWECVKDEAEGGAGHPPFVEDILLNILRKVHEQVRTGRPYFRELILPYEKGAKVYDQIVHDACGAEVVAVIQPQQQYDWFIHQLNYFRHDNQRYMRVEEELTTPICVAIWTNEAYREIHPPTIDVEDCFQAWEHNSFGPKSNVVDYNTVYNCFPERNRGGETKLDEFDDCKFCK